MSARKNYVRTAEHRQRRDDTDMTTRDLADHLEREIEACWAKFSPWYGEALGSWVGRAGKTPEKRLGLAAASIMASLLCSVNSHFFAEVDYDDRDRPTALIFHRPSADTLFIDVKVTARRIKIGNQWLALATPDAGARIIRTLAREAGAYFGRMAA